MASLLKGSYLVNSNTKVFVNASQVSGTERQHVASDYAARLSVGASEVLRGFDTVSKCFFGFSSFRFLASLIIWSFLFNIYIISVKKAPLTIRWLLRSGRGGFQ